MKKIITSMILAAMVLSALASCSAPAKAPEESTYVSVETEDATESLPEYVNSTPKDYDEEGNFILTSTDDRAVFTYSTTGYAVFTFTGETVAKIQRVIGFESPEAAQEYVTEKTLEAIEKDEVPATMSINGNFVIISIAFNSTENSLGSYYAKSKTQIFEAFANEVQQ